MLSVTSEVRTIDLIPVHELASTELVDAYFAMKDALQIWQMNFDAAVRDGVHNFSVPTLLNGITVATGLADKAVEKFVSGVESLLKQNLK